MKEAIAIRLADEIFLVTVEELVTWYRVGSDEPGYDELIELMPHGTIGNGVVAAIGRIPVDEDGDIVVEQLEAVEPVPPSGGKQRFAVEP
jgi:hypothetical protein